MLPYLATFINTNGLAFPDTLTVNASGPSATDGTEVNKNMVDDLWGSRYALMDKAGISPNSIAEAPGASQMLEATEKAFGLGAGIEKFWQLTLDPATTGHRMLLLNNQGILRASFLDLDAAIYVGDGLNPTAPYKYHADDAAGTLRNTAGIYLILPPGKQLYEKQYSEAAGDFAVTGTNWTTTSAVVVPYQTADGAWRLRGNINGSYTGSPTTPPIIALSGVTFKTITEGQSVTATVLSLGEAGRNTSLDDARANSGAGTISVITDGTSSLEWLLVSFDVELDSEPTFTDGFNYPLAISY